MDKSFWTCIKNTMFGDHCLSIKRKTETETERKRERKRHKDREKERKRGTSKV